MKYQLVIVLPFNTLLVFSRTFDSRDEALDYRDTTIFPALEPRTLEEVQNYRGFVIYFPFGEDNHDRPEAERTDRADSAGGTEPNPV